MLKRLDNIAKKIAKAESQKGRVNIALVTDTEIKKLNKKYRKINRATDVLSFYMGEDGILGDIIISVDTAKTNAVRYDVNYLDELKRLVIHGALHLAGYDHIKKTDRIIMRKKEDIYAQKIL